VFLLKRFSPVRALLGGADSTALYLGTNRDWSVRELVEATREVTGREFLYKLVRGGPATRRHIAAASRARHLLDWQPLYTDLTTQVRHACAWRVGNSRTWKRMWDGLRLLQSPQDTG
jgi:UDP-glucose 4-epimerase